MCVVLLFHAYTPPLLSCAIFGRFIQQSFFFPIKTTRKPVVFATPSLACHLKGGIENLTSHYCYWKLPTGGFFFYAKGPLSRKITVLDFFYSILRFVSFHFTQFFQAGSTNIFPFKRSNTFTAITEHTGGSILF